MDISAKDVKEVLTTAQNWKSPGPDRIQNFWYKKFSSCHAPLAELFTACIQNPEMMPRYFTHGTTFLIPKGPMSDDPSKFRPITCLPTIYKILTACINRLIYSHLEEHIIIAEEQKGCIKNQKDAKNN